MTLGRQVEHHDDNSTQHIYDLRIGKPSSPDAAIEVTGAVDRVAAQTWNIGPAKGPWQFALQGDWLVTIARQTNLKVLRQHLEKLLLELENGPQAGKELREEDDVWEDLERLGVLYAHSYRSDGNGLTHLTIDGEGGAIDTEGASIPEWVTTFLADSHQSGIIDNLRMSGAPKRHVFIWVELCGAPWAVLSYLTRDLSKLPELPPRLPQEVTDVWVVPVMSWGERGGIRWDGREWSSFSASGPELFQA